MAVDFHSESDVKDYLEKLGIEYRFGCYSEKRPEGKPNQLEFYVIHREFQPEKTSNNELIFSSVSQCVICSETI